MTNAQESTPTINFYSVRAEYGEFSNFYRRPIKVDGKTWPSTEHYFQAKKFPGTEHETAIRKAASCQEAADMGRDRSRPLRRDWESVKDSVMETALIAKFTQHDDLKQILLGTGDAKLVEHTTKDSYWGDGGNGSGKNMLGKLLMKVRDSNPSVPTT